MSLIPFPNVPPLPGVPQIARSVNFPTTVGPVIGQAAALASLWSAITRKSVWGIFRNQNAIDQGGLFIPGQTTLVPVVVADSVRDFGYSNEWNVSDFPIQDGGFASYNKVNNPFEIQLRLSKGGSQTERADFLQQIEDIAPSLELYEIITPEKTYSNCNVIRVEVSRRGEKGAYFLSEVDVFFREVRFVTPQYSDTAANTQDAQQPSALPVQNNGILQTQAAPPGIGIPDDSTIVGGVP